MEPETPDDGRGDGIPAMVLEALAANEHRGWASYMDYFLGKLPENKDGSRTIPAGYVNALLRQVATSYEDLTPEEQEQDRDEVRGFLRILRAGRALASADPPLGDVPGKEV